MDLVSPLREAKGVMKNSTKRSEYIGTFIKASGAVRTMRFTTAAANLGKRGLITVWDVESRGLRKFNLNTLMSRIVAAA
jgi:hypothetical protein